MDYALELIARSLSDYAYLGLFLVLSVGGFGLPIPEEIVLLAAGLFVARGVTEPVPTLVACGVGQVVGDFLFFAVGRRWGRGALRGIVRRLVPESRVALVEERMRRWGRWVVFFGRYLTGIRPAVFLAAGASTIPAREFVLIDGVSALVALVVWVGMGWLFSGWIEVALHAVSSAEELILAGLLAIVLVILLERVLVKFGSLREGSPAVRIGNRIRIPILVVTVLFAVLLARQHQLYERARLVAAATAPMPHVVGEMGNLIEVLPSLAGPDGPVEVVFVGARPLLEAALGEAGYLPAEADRGRGYALRPDVRLARAVGEGEAAHAMAFWRSNFVHRSEPVWFGRFEWEATSAEIRDLSRALTRSHYALRTAIGPRYGPRDRRRVLVAVLRHPTIQP